MITEKVVKKAMDKYGEKNVIVATPLTGKCQCNKEVVVLPLNDVFCPNCYGFWKVD